MAKRSRLSSRPGQRRPTIRRTAAHPDAGATSSSAEPQSATEMPLSTRGGLTSLEEARAAELEAKLVAQEKAATESARRARERAKGGGRIEVSAVPLSVRAAAEYAYVLRDVKRILLITAMLLGILAVLHVLINIAGVISI